MARPAAANRLGTELRLARGRLRLSLDEVGRRLGLANGNFVGMVERGLRLPGDELLGRLAELYGLEPRPLLLRKLEAARGPAAELLARGPEPRHPRIRKLLLLRAGGPLDSEASRAALRAEIEARPWGLLERCAFCALGSELLDAELDSDASAPRALRGRAAQPHGRRLSPDEAEAMGDEVFGWLREVLVFWTISGDRDGGGLEELRLAGRASGEKRLPILLGAVGEAGPSVAPVAAASAATLDDLLSLLGRDGLSESDLAEIRMIVEWKRRKLGAARPAVATE
jgi:transcriptional regulator with XRE-family HTH domain